MSKMVYVVTCSVNEKEKVAHIFISKAQECQILGKSDYVAYATSMKRAEKISEKMACDVRKKVDKVEYHM